MYRLTCWWAYSTLNRYPHLYEHMWQKSEKNRKKSKKWHKLFVFKIFRYFDVPIDRERIDLETCGRAHSTLDILMNKYVTKKWGKKEKKSNRKVTKIISFKLKLSEKVSAIPFLERMLWKNVFVVAGCDIWRNRTEQRKHRWYQNEECEPRFSTHNSHKETSALCRLLQANGRLDICTKGCQHEERIRGTYVVNWLSERSLRFDETGIFSFVRCLYGCLSVGPV